MATPTLVGTGTYSRAAGTLTKTVSHTLDSAANMLVVFADNGNVGAGDITSVTFNGVAMTKFAAASLAVASYRGNTYYMLAASLPAGGAAYDIVVTYPATTAGTTPVVCAVNVAGAKQNAPEAGAALSLATVDPITTATITTVASATLIVQGIIGTQANTVSSVSNGQTTVNNQSARGVFTLTGPTPGAAQSMNADLSAAYTTGASLLVSIEGAASAASGVGTTPKRQSAVRRFTIL